MTREEAIRELNTFKIGAKSELGETALDVAIKALEQQPCEDTISRQAVLNTLNRMDSVLDEDRTVETYKELLVACYNDLPPVTPEHNVLDKIRAEIIKYEGDCRLSVDEYPSCKQCTDNVFGSIYAILDKYKAENEDNE